MKVPSPLIAALAATTATALLIPFPIPAPIIEGQVFRPIDGNLKSWNGILPIENSPSGDKEIYITIQLGDDNKTLLLNDATIYPVQSGGQAFTAALVDHSIQAYSSPPRSSSDDRPPHQHDVSSFVLNTRIRGMPDGIDMDLRVQALDDDTKPVHVGNLGVGLTRDENGGLTVNYVLIFPVHVTADEEEVAAHDGTQPPDEKLKEFLTALMPTTPRPDLFEPHHHHHDHDHYHRLSPPPCPVGVTISSAFCRAHNFVTSAFSSLIDTNPPRRHVSCHSTTSRHPIMYPGPDSAIAGPPHIHGGPAKFSQFQQPARPDFPAANPETASSLARTVFTHVTNILVPASIGVIAGIAASMLGMVVGTAIAWLWVRLVRGGKKGTASVSAHARRQAERSNVSVDEKAVLMARDREREKEPTKDNDEDTCIVLVGDGGGLWSPTPRSHYDSEKR